MAQYYIKDTLSKAYLSFYRLQGKSYKWEWSMYKEDATLFDDAHEAVVAKDRVDEWLGCNPSFGSSYSLEVFANETKSSSDNNWDRAMKGL